MAAWTGRVVGDAIDVAVAVDEILGAPTGTGAFIDELGRIAESIGMVALNGSAPFYAVMSSALPTLGELDRDAAYDALVLLGDARSHCAANQGAANQGAASQGAAEASRWGIAAQELDAACGATELGLRRLLGDEPARPDYEDVIETQRAAWLLSSRSGGLEDSLARLIVPR